jgi:ATP-binding cassette subfamily F protein uup
VFEGDGKITYLPGNYTDYAARQKQAESLKKNTPIVAKAPVPKKEKSQTVKMTYHEKKEYETIEAEVEQLENTLKALEENELAFASDYSKLREILKEKEEIEAQLFHKMERWEYLTEKAQEIN